MIIIEIKDNAKLKLKEYYSLGKEPCAIRIRVKGYTWAGLNADIVLEELNDPDKFYTYEGINFIVDKHIEESFSKVIIEYTQDWFKKGFAVRVKS